MASNVTNGDGAPIALLDPGWFFLLAGIVLLGATVLMPAADDMEEVRLQRDRALVVEDHKSLRLRSYEEYLRALEREEPALVMALAASQLNQIPQGRSLLLDTPHLQAFGSGDASVFGALEPAAARLPERQRVHSMLAGWTGSDTLRPWLIIAGALSVFIGLMPQARPVKRRVAADTPGS